MTAAMQSARCALDTSRPLMDIKRSPIRSRPDAAFTTHSIIINERTSAKQILGFVFGRMEPYVFDRTTPSTCTCSFLINSAINGC